MLLGREAGALVEAGTCGPYGLPPYPPFAFRRSVVARVAAVDLPADVAAETGEDGADGTDGP